MLITKDDILISDSNDYVINVVVAGDLIIAGYAASNSLVPTTNIGIVSRQFLLDNNYVLAPFNSEGEELI